MADTPKEGLWQFEQLSGSSWEPCGSGMVHALDILAHLASNWELVEVLNGYPEVDAAHMILIQGKNHLKGQTRLFTRLW